MTVRRHRALRTCVYLLPLVLLAAGCSENAGKPSNTPADPAAGPPITPPIAPADTMHPEDLRQLTASYDCGQGNRIDVVRDQIARVALNKEGTIEVVKIERIARSAPPTFQDNGLTFSIPENAPAYLDDEKGNTLTCTPTEIPKATGG